MSTAVSFKWDSHDITISITSYLLNLRSAFGTSHSSTTSRQNALIKIQINNWTGFGEIGLPPKKPLCYTANYEDVNTYFLHFREHIENIFQQYKSITDVSYDPFQELSEDYFKELRNTTNTEPLPQIIRVLLMCLDTCTKNTKSEYSLTAQSGFEEALFDLWAKAQSKLLSSLILGTNEYLSKPGFYTASLNDDITKILQSAEFGHGYTPYLKIKLDSNFERGVTILNALYDSYKSQDLKGKWSIDANSAWDPETSLKFLHFLKSHPIREFIYMIEQPFPVEFCKVGQVTQEQHDAWFKVKHECGNLGILLYADESISTADDVAKLKDYVHGVNVKLEKAGGIRGALKVIQTAIQHHLKIWIGMMVASRLGSNVAAHLLPLSDNGGDLDGALLVSEESQIHEGGFSWENGLVVFPSSATGVGVTSKQKE